MFWISHPGVVLVYTLFQFVADVPWRTAVMPCLLIIDIVGLDVTKNICKQLGRSFTDIALTGLLF